MYIKYCKKEHSVNDGCNTILIGTLKSYVKNDSSFSTELIYDNNEIKKSVCSSQDIQLSSGELHKATGIKFDQSKDGDIFLDITDSNGQVSGLTLGASSQKASFIDQSGEIPNCFIYCLANTNEVNQDDGKKINKDYNSSFEIKNIHDFCYTTANLLLKNLTLEDFDFDTSKDTLAYLKNIQIKIICRDIEYKESKTAHITEKNKNKILNEIDKYERWLFVKDKKYEDVPEFRIAFIIMDEYGTILSVKKESKLLYLPEMLGISQT